DISKNIFYIQPLILLILFGIGLFVLYIAISIRITQVFISLALTEIRRALMKMLLFDRAIDQTTKHLVIHSYLMDNYSPPKLDNRIQIGWNWKESAIALIGLLIFVNSLVLVYFIKIELNLSTCWLFFVLLIAMFVQILILYYRFKSDLSPESQTKGKNDMTKVLKDVYEFLNQKSKKSD
ncbi:MAG TPA: hypothetical protein VJJ51_02030, partial [Candidatus Methanoperedens sp.]|nr:hypothetical protein [Candidatus Methanoperedens sp.]